MQLKDLKVSDGLKNIGKNGVNEFFEDLTYNVAYTEVLKTLKGALGLDHKDSSVVKEAFESSLNIMVSSALFLYIRKQEEWLNKIIELIFSLLASAITFIGGKLAYGAIKNKFAKFKGRGKRLSKIMDFFGNSRSDAINSARLVVETGQFYSSNKYANQQSSSSGISGYIQSKSGIIQQESHNLNIARAKVQSINETLLFKLFTKNFTQSDIEMINRICGNKTNGNITKEQLNQVADFMYITDDKGQITGLSEQFLTMLNGLGYMHNKTKKS